MLKKIREKELKNKLEFKDLIKRYILQVIGLLAFLREPKQDPRLYK